MDEFCSHMDTKRFASKGPPGNTVMGYTVWRWSKRDTAIKEPLLDLVRFWCMIADLLIPKHELALRRQLLIYWINKNVVQTFWSTSKARVRPTGPYLKNALAFCRSSNWCYEIGNLLYWTQNVDSELCMASSGCFVLLACHGLEVYRLQPFQQCNLQSNLPVWWFL